MIDCPYCTQANIEGSDHCDQCGQPLDDLHLSVPESQIERGLMRDRIGALHPHPPVVVRPSTTLREVLALLVQKGIGCVFVVDESQRPIGIFSERDAVVRLGDKYADCLDHPIQQYMTPQPQSLQESAKVAFVVQRMNVGGYRHVPVVQPSTQAISGVVSVRDILQYLTERI